MRGDNSLVAPAFAFDTLAAPAASDLTAARGRVVAVPPATVFGASLVTARNSCLTVRTTGNSSTRRRAANDTVCRPSGDRRRNRSRNGSTSYVDTSTAAPRRYSRSNDRAHRDVARYSVTATLRRALPPPDDAIVNAPNAP